MGITRDIVYSKAHNLRDKLEHLITKIKSMDNGEESIKKVKRQLTDSFVLQNDIICDGFCEYNKNISVPRLRGDELHSLSIISFEGSKTRIWFIPPEDELTLPNGKLIAVLNMPIESVTVVFSAEDSEFIFSSIIENLSNINPGRPSRNKLYQNAPKFGAWA